jgi:hypothetical protein
VQLAEPAAAYDADGQVAQSEAPVEDVYLPSEQALQVPAEVAAV